MDTSNDDTISTDSAKLRLDVIMAEYSMVRNSVLTSRQVQSQLDGLALAALGLSIPLVVLLLGQRPEILVALAALPILFCAIAFVQIRDERQIVLDSVYADDVLRAQCDQLLSQVSRQVVHTLGYEAFLSPHSAPTLLVQWILILSRAGISLLIGTGFLVVYFVLRQGPPQMNPVSVEMWLPLIDIVMLLAVSAAAYLPARMRYDFFQKKRHDLEAAMMR